MRICCNNILLPSITEDERIRNDFAASFLFCGRCEASDCVSGAACFVVGQIRLVRVPSQFTVPFSARIIQIGSDSAGR